MNHADDWYVLGVPEMTLEEVEALESPSEDVRLIAEVSMRLIRLNSMARIGGVLKRMRMNVRTRPLIGGLFGVGRFVIASYAMVNRGLDHVEYMVLEEETWLAIGTGKSKQEALTFARKTLELADPLLFVRYVAALKVEQERRYAEARKAEREAIAERNAKFEASRPASVKSIPKRRRQIFEASEGKCHYCGMALTLDGRWHIEHKMPRALMGGNDPSNLVASCAPCNHKKRDKTDVEVMAERARGNA